MQNPGSVYVDPMVASSEDTVLVGKQYMIIILAANEYIVQRHRHVVGVVVVVLAITIAVAVGVGVITFHMDAVPVVWTVKPGCVYMDSEGWPNANRKRGLVKKHYGIPQVA